MKKAILFLTTLSSIWANTISTSEENFVKEILPNTKIDHVKKSHIDGFYEAYLKNGKMLYIHPFSKSIIFGEIYSNTGVNLSAKKKLSWKKAIERDEITNITKDKLTKDAVKVNFGKGSSEYEFVIFTDPECPYCHKVEKHFANFDTTVYVNFMPLQHHKKAEKWSLEALSAKDFKKAIGKIKETGEDLDIEITSQAKEQLEKMKALGAELNITGTPKIFIIQKSSNRVIDVVNGANIPKITKYIKE